MRAIVTQAGTEYATVQLETEYDGVNPTDVFEFTVALRSRPHHAPRSFLVEVRAGTSIEFAEHEDDAESFPDTLYHEHYDPELHHVA